GAQLPLCRVELSEIGDRVSREPSRVIQAAAEPHISRARGGTERLAQGREGGRIPASRGREGRLGDESRGCDQEPGHQGEAQGICVPEWPARQETAFFTFMRSSAPRSPRARPTASAFAQKCIDRKST